VDLGRTTPPHVAQHLRVEADFEALARLISDGVAYLSSEGIVRAWSAPAAEITGVACDAAIGHSLGELFARVEPPLSFALTPESLAMWTNDEHRRAIHATVLSISDGWLLSFGKQRTYAAIEQLKAEIVAAVSHELKTPIASIKAFATTMRENPAGTADRHDEFLSTIEEQADRLAHAVDDLLLVARVDAEHLVRRREHVPLDRLIDLAIERLGSQAAARIKRETTEIIVQCDPELLASALAHVLDNGLKFSADGTIVTARGERDARGATIHVHDSGIGIGEDHLPYIFERFYRVERNLTSPTGGSGLGLFVARSIAHAHGGSVAVRSSLHEGSTFTFTIPERT
jgi:signal transduction histidine kinase